ncbi:hypothetical protein EB73_03415 [Mycobacterium sp. SWH-M3]|nr:hypothetical protein EB73_03415 [Mycobacterium sp. SWH-M3]
MVTVLCAVVVGGCSAPGATSGAGSSSAPVSGTKVQSPAAPISQLTSTGQHCFGSAVDVAAAAARIAADTERQVRMIVDARRIADAGGPLPPIGYDTIFVVSDPDANNCVQVTASVYNPPPAR